MKTGTTTTAILAVAVQWIGQAATLYMRALYLRIAEELGIQLPLLTILAFRVTHPAVWVTLGVICTAGIIAAERFVRAERVRFAIQFANAAVWSLLNLAAIWALTSISLSVS